MRPRGSPKGHFRLTPPVSSTAPAAHPGALDPPRGFRGTFTDAARARDDFSVAAGPLRVRPAAVCRPVDADDLTALARWAAEEGRPLIPRGAGTGMPGGNVGDGIVVDLTQWTTLSPLDVERRHLRVEPGVVADRVQDKADHEGLFLPPLPSSSDRCTIGGMVANNAAGARTFRYGAMREWVDAVEIVAADGEQIRLERGGADPDRFAVARKRLTERLGSVPTGWPAVRKNSSGYALDDFLPDGDALSLVVGSEGTLCFVTAVELRLAPAPEHRALVLISVADLDSVQEAVRVARTVGASACEFLGRRYLEIAELESDPRTAGLCRDAAALLLLELDGSAEEVFERLEALRVRAPSFCVGSREVTDERERAGLWRIRHAASPVIARQAERGLVSMQFIEDSVVPSERLADYLRGLEEILASEETDAVVFGHAGDANVHVNPLVDVARTDWRPRVRRILDRTAGLVADLGGTLSGEHGDGRIRGVFHEQVWGPRVSGAFREAKASLDPAGILNPGVVVPLPEQDPLEGLSPLGGRR